MICNCVLFVLAWRLRFCGLILVSFDCDGLFVGWQVSYGNSGMY